MRIGILADIHGQVTNLRSAVEKLASMQVDRFVVLGDVIFSSEDASDTVAILRERQATGVFGNHELGLCLDPSKELRDIYDADVVRFFGTLSPHFAIDNVLFSHTLPTEDATDPCAYYLGQTPEEDDALTASFQRYPHRVIMVGHFHRWFAATPDGPLDWQGETRLSLDPHQRYFFVINAVMNGWAAMLDTSRNILKPIRL